MNWLDYRKELGIGFDDHQKVRYFMVKMFNVLRDVSYDFDPSQIGRTEYIAFCNISGTEMRINLNDGEYYRDIIHTLGDHDERLEDFLAYYCAFVNCQKDQDYKFVDRKYYMKILEKKLEEAKIGCEILEDKDGYFVFPKGAKELDDALASEVLEWLKDYPGARKTYITALKQYADGIYIRDVADNLRKALETFLQEFLHNDKNLENNKNEICKYLGKKGVDAGISGLYQPLINAYKNINDRCAKHNDKVDAKLLEFLLYQTGILIRMVLVIDK